MFNGRILNPVSEYRLRQLVAYPQYLADFAAREPSLGLEEQAEEARETFFRNCEIECADQCEEALAEAKALYCSS